MKPIVERLSKRDLIQPVVIITIAFLLSRALYYAAGIRFDASASTLGATYQFIDPRLLRENLLESVFYLHSQPPLFNLLLGCVLKLFPGNETVAFGIIWMLLGYILAVTMFLLMRRLGVSYGINLTLTVLFIIGPQCVLFENWLFYTTPVAAMMALTALWLHRYISNGRLGDGFVFFLLLSVIALTRSLFHIAWFVMMAGMVLWYFKTNRRKTVIAMLFPLLLVLSLYVKNGLLFGSFSSSTWLGMNVARMATFRLSEDVRRDMVRRGDLSPLALIERFRPLQDYRGMISDSTKRGIEVLDQEVKSTGATNYNHTAYIELSRAYMRDALHVIAHNPGVYLDAYTRSYFTYLLPSTNYLFVEGNRKHIRGWDRVYNLLLLAQPLAYDTERSDRGSTDYFVTTLLTMSLVLFVAVPFLMLYGWRVVRRSLKARGDATPFAITLLYISINLAYVTIVGNAFEMAENNRFRFTIDSYFLAVAGLFLTGRWNWLKNRMQEGPSGMASATPGEHYNP
jgi:hypothetical protein